MLAIRPRKPARFSPSVAVGVCIAAVLAAGAPVTAQDAPADSSDSILVPVEDFRAMQQRLEEAENRLQALETRRLPAIGAEHPVRLDDAYDADLAKRLEAIEKDLDKQAEAAAKKKADDAKKPTQKWTGRIHLDYWGFPEDSPGANAFETGDDSNSPDDRFLFRRVRFGVQGDIPDNMLYKAEFDINQPQTPQFKDCYIGWKELPILQTVLLGNQKRPYGLDHINSSRYNVFMERPYFVESANPDARRLGLASYGVSDDEYYNWRYGAYMMQDLQTLGTVFVDPLTEDYQAEFAGRFANTFWYDECSGGRGYAHWGVSGTVASPSGRNYDGMQAQFATRPEARTAARWIDTGRIIGTDHYELLGFEGVLNLGPLQVVGEYQNIWLQRDNASDLRFDGGYIYFAYFLTGEHMAWDRATSQLDRVKPFQNFWVVDTCDDGAEAGWGAWQVAMRLSKCDFNDDNIAGGIGQSITFGMNWHWNPYSRMQFNYVYGQIDDRLPPVDGQTSGNYGIVGARFMVDF